LNRSRITATRNSTSNIKISVKDFQLNNSVKRPKSLESTFYPIKVKGEYFGVIVGYLEDEPYELFAIRLEKNIPQHEGKTIKFGKNHYGFESDLLKINNILETELSDEEKSTCLYVSMLLRHDVGIKHIVKTTKKTSDSIASFSSAICRVLSKYDELSQQYLLEFGVLLGDQNVVLEVTNSVRRS
jgi:ribonucleoside-diphosphate reductase alpha chain